MHSDLLCNKDFSMCKYERQQILFPIWEHINSQRTALRIKLKLGPVVYYILFASSSVSRIYRYLKVYYMVT